MTFTCLLRATGNIQLLVFVFELGVILLELLYKVLLPCSERTLVRSVLLLPFLETWLARFICNLWSDLGVYLLPSSSLLSALRETGHSTLPYHDHILKSIMSRAQKESATSCAGCILGSSIGRYLKASSLGIEMALNVVHQAVNASSATKLS
jgi:hypothetical protein